MLRSFSAPLKRARAGVTLNTCSLLNYSACTRIARTRRVARTIGARRAQKAVARRAKGGRPRSGAVPCDGPCAPADAPTDPGATAGAPTGTGESAGAAPAGFARVRWSDTDGSDPGPSRRRSSSTPPRRAADGGTRAALCARPDRSGLATIEPKSMAAELTQLAQSAAAAAAVAATGSLRLARIAGASAAGQAANASAAADAHERATASPFVAGVASATPSAPSTSATATGATCRATAKRIAKRIAAAAGWPRHGSSTPAAKAHSSEPTPNKVRSSSEPRRSWQC